MCNASAIDLHKILRIFTGFFFTQNSWKIIRFPILNCSLIAQTADQIAQATHDFRTLQYFNVSDEQIFIYCFREFQNAFGISFFKRLPSTE